MTADKIRETDIGAQLQDCAFFLREIAAQIAELNTNLLLVRDSTEAIAIDGISVKVRQ